MKRILVGIILGAVLAQPMATSAHFTRNTSYRHDWLHVKFLEQRVSSLESRVSSLESKVTAMVAKTGQLTSTGTYTGSISQTTGTIDATQVDTPLLCEGDPARWRPFGDGLNC